MKTPEQKDVFVETKLPAAGSTVRPVTDEEYRVMLVPRERMAGLRASIAQLEKELKEMESQCDHQFVYDTEGFAYDIRTCFVCGNQIGLI